MPDAMKILERYKPGIQRRGLFFVGSAVWGVAGLVLMLRTIMLVDFSPLSVILLGAAIAGGALFFQLVFQHVARRHIKRMDGKQLEQPCLFSFLDWRGYGVMVVMISGGILLRASGVLPGFWIGMLYAAMGTALILASVQFFRAGLQDRSSGQPHTPA